MKYILLALVLSNLSYAEVEREGDLLQPVSDVSQMQKQEEEKIPTLDEVPMYEATPESNEEINNYSKETAEESRNRVLR
jgi:hypothetical protein